MIKIVFEQKERFQMHSGTKDSVNNIVRMTVGDVGEALSVLARIGDSVQEIAITLAPVDSTQEGASDET